MVLGLLIGLFPACSVADLTSGGPLDATGQPGQEESVGELRDAGAAKEAGAVKEAAAAQEAGAKKEAAVVRPDDGAGVAVVPPPTAVGIENLLNLRYLDVANASTSDGAEIWTWSHTGGTNQLWTFMAMGGGEYEIVNQNSGSCVDVEGGATGNVTAVQQYFCWGGLNQQFELVAYSGNVHIVGTQSGKCLASSTQEDGASVYIWDCSSDLSEQWAIAQ
jgi:hypothetical protein